ncbi:MAG: DUF86 domain-containing protein [Endomicrobiia bacterium]|nr:DUF86 domain-containing protein [Endomicrobiia bacterium]
MRGKREFKDYIDDIFASMQNIEEYTLGMDYAAFCKDKKTVDAVVRNIEIIGGAAKNVRRK